MENLKKRGDLRSLGLLLVLCLVFMAVIVAALSNDIAWVGNSVNYGFSEDGFSTHNLSSNITGTGTNITFSVYEDDTNKVKWNGAIISYSQISSWINITNSSSGNLIFNATRDNQTGNFIIPIRVSWTNSSESSSYTSGVGFNFTVNATNDFPLFVNSSVSASYSALENSSFNTLVDATDEENHFPLIFYANFTSCNLAQWSTRGEGNCTLFSIQNISNTSAAINFTPTHNDVGVYYINLSVMDSGILYNCSSGYCETDYSTNRTTYYSQLITFEVNATLQIDAANCTGQTLQENQSFSCYINITTPGLSDALTMWSNATTTHSVNAPISSWFYELNNSDASSFVQTAYINVTPQKTEIGNWTINFTVRDSTTNQIKSVSFYVYANRTTNSVPVLASITNVTTITMLPTTINFTIYDDDLLIPDKTYGFNEIISYSLISENPGVVPELFNITNLEAISGTNQSLASMTFNANYSQNGTYVFNLTITDIGIGGETSSDSQIFNITILSKTYPQWNQTTYTFNLTVNSSFAITSGFYLNLSDLVNDSEGNILNFSNSSAFPLFNLTRTGIINFTPYKSDVGNWEFNVTATNGLSNSSIFIFNITNINSAPAIQPLQGNDIEPGTGIVSGTNVNVTEGLEADIFLVVQDEDLRVTQKSAYNESINISLSIINSSGSSVDLFSFINSSSCIGDCGDNETGFIATFTPTKLQKGAYNVSINATDINGTLATLNFTLTILEINNAPVLMNLENKTLKVNETLYYLMNATDIEDGNSTTSGNTNLTYNITYISGGREGIDFNSYLNTTSGELNITFNSTRGGKYHLNVTVNDMGLEGIGNKSDSKAFWIFVYDVPTIISDNSSVINMTENTAFNLVFAGNHSMENNLTYELWIDSISCINSNVSNCSYSNTSLRNTTLNLGNGTNFTISFTPNFTDESYGLLKNLTLFASSSLYPELNVTKIWSINISHYDAPLTFDNDIGEGASHVVSGGASKNILMTDYFSDVDAQDPFYYQKIVFTLANYTASSTISSSIVNWENGSIPSINFSTTETSATVNYSILATAYNISDVSQAIENISSNNFSVELSTSTTTIITPTPTPSSGGGGGGATTVKYYSLKLILPEDVIISEKGFIQIPFLVKNTGGVTLNGINLTSSVKFNSEDSSAVKISLPQAFLPELKVNDSVNLSMTIYADTSKSGKYKATIYANVTSPRFLDWADFFIELKKTNETDAEKTLVFTEKLVAENPECIELTELVNSARKLYEQEDFIGSLELSEKATDACEKAISSNEQFSFMTNSVKKNFYYILYATLFVFVLGFIFYIYKRVRFNKSKLDSYGVYNGTV